MTPPIIQKINNPRSRSNEEILALLGEAEDRFAVDQWIAHGVHLWPLIRYQIATENHRLAKISPPNDSAAPEGFVARKLRPLRPLLAMGQGLRAGVRASLVADRAHNDWPVRSVDALLYGDGCSITQLDGQWYDRFCDPLHTALERRNRTALTWQPLHTYYVPRTTRSAFIQPFIDSVLLAARIEKAADQTLHPGGTPISELSEMLTWIRARAPEFTLYTEQQYAGVALYTARFAKSYRPLLERIKPKVAFKVCYYGVEGMGFVMACRALGIPVVDLQHGVAGAQHFAYGGWRKVPPQGYETIPTHFWCWSDADRDAILQWNGPDHGHVPLVGGNPFLSAWVRGDRTLVAASEARLAPVLAQSKGLTQALWTAHGFEDQAMIEQIAQLVHDTREHTHWWLRMHPVRAHRRSDFAEALAKTQGRYNLAEANELPVYPLLRVMDVHLTEVSSTTLEAAAFGVPTVLVCPSEVGLYAELVATGWAKVVHDMSAVSQAVTEQIRDRERLRSIRAKSIPQSEEAMEQTLTQLGLT